jgi:hypothetical protein
MVPVKSLFAINFDVSEASAQSKPVINDGKHAKRADVQQGED